MHRDPANLRFSCFNLADQNYLITQKVIIDFLKFNLSEIFKNVKYKFLFCTICNNMISEISYIHCPFESMSVDKQSSLYI